MLGFDRCVGLDLIQDADAGKAPRLLGRMLMQLRPQHRGAELLLLVR
jgi:hypothetical protein